MMKRALFSSRVLLLLYRRRSFRSPGALPVLGRPLYNLSD
jgi:hypothetical protein